MPRQEIVIRNAREHNLKGVSLEIPKNKLVVITGPSGSGKSSLAFDTLYAEGQRRYVESLSSYARQFLGVQKKPDVDDIEGLYTDASFAKSLGFSGKASISPRHVEGINEVFSPTQAEIDYAHEVMETIRIAKEQGKGVVSLRGKMIDAPIVERARQVIEMEKAMFGEVEDDE